MFRRLSTSLPSDFEYPADLKSLGYHLHKDTDQIHSIEPPHHDFNSFISRNERKNEVLTEAYHECIRSVVLSRLLDLGLKTHHLCIEDAGNASTDSVQPYVPILASANIREAPRTILYFGEKMQDLGIFAYRTVGQEAVNKGSAVEFVKAVNDREDTAVILANCGQLLWHHTTCRPMTQVSWRAQKRANAVHESTPISDHWNRVKGHEDVETHVKSVIEFYASQNQVKGKLSIIAIGEGATGVVSYLNTNWKLWSDRITAVAVGDGYAWDRVYTTWTPEFQRFFAGRARIYLVSKEPINSPIYGMEDFGAPCYSSGEEKWTECIMPRAYSKILEWFDVVEGTPGYQQL